MSEQLLEQKDEYYAEQKALGIAMEYGRLLARIRMVAISAMAFGASALPSLILIQSSFVPQRWSTRNLSLWILSVICVAVTQSLLWYWYFLINKLKLAEAGSFDAKHPSERLTEQLYQDSKSVFLDRFSPVLVGGFFVLCILSFGALASRPQLDRMGKQRLVTDEEICKAASTIERESRIHWIVLTRLEAIMKEIERENKLGANQLEPKKDKSKKDDLTLEDIALGRELPAKIERIKKIRYDAISIQHDAIRSLYPDRLVKDADRDLRDLFEINSYLNTHLSASKILADRDILTELMESRGRITSALFSLWKNSGID